MLILAATTDKLQLVSSAAATLDVMVSFVDCSNAVPPVVQDVNKQLTAIVTATTTDICAVPDASERRNVKTIHVRNKHASLACDVTIVFDANGTDYELHKVTLNAGDMLEYVEGIGFFTIVPTTKLDKKLYVTADVINATTSFADVTGLTQAVEANKRYAFEAHLIHIANATTTGARFGVNGPTMTNVIISTIDTVTGSVTGSAHSAGSVSALDTAATAQTTGAAANNLAILSGGFEPSAAGTFAIRCQSEVAVAAGLTVRRGSWLRIWESDN